MLPYLRAECGYPNAAFHLLQHYCFTGLNLCTIRHQLRIVLSESATHIKWNVERAYYPALESSNNTYLYIVMSSSLPTPILACISDVDGLLINSEGYLCRNIQRHSLVLPQTSSLLERESSAAEQSDEVGTY